MRVCSLFLAVLLIAAGCSSTPAATPVTHATTPTSTAAPIADPTAVPTASPAAAPTSTVTPTATESPAPSPTSSPDCSPGCMPDVPIVADTGWGEWGGPYNQGGNWLWSDYLSFEGVSECFAGVVEVYPCPITLNWRQSPRADGFRVYVAPLTDSQWVCGPNMSGCHPLDLECS